jgi:hypothetical protein
MSLLEMLSMSTWDGRKGNKRDMMFIRSRRGRSFPSRMHGAANAIGGLALVTANYRDHTARVNVVAVSCMRTICTPLQPRPTKRTELLSQRINGTVHSFPCGQSQCESLHVHNPNHRNTVRLEHVYEQTD